MSNVPPKFYRLCRLCLSEDKSESLSIFDKEGTVRDIPRKILTCLSILIKEDDRLPKIICLKCSEQLETFSKFKEVATKAEEILNNFILYTQQLTGTEEEKMRHTEDLLANITSSVLDIKPEPISIANDVKEELQESAHLPTCMVEERTPFSISFAVPHDTKQSVGMEIEPSASDPDAAVVPEPSVEPIVQECLSSTIEDSYERNAPCTPPREAFIKVKPPSVLQAPRILNKEFNYRTSEDSDIQPEPADLSNKRAENLTCVPEFDYVRDDTDAHSISSNSSDPDRLEVDMSQATDDHNSNSTTHSAPSPVYENSSGDLPNAAEWRHTLHCQNNGLSNSNEVADLSGDASQLLRKLITCRKLGMSVTSTSEGGASPHVLNYSLFQSRMPVSSLHGGLGISEKEKSSGRRKQSYPTKANNGQEAGEKNKDDDYGGGGGNPDFTGNNPWCNVGGNNKAKSVGTMSRRMPVACTNCGTQTTTIWRRNLRGEMVCNACGLYFKLHGIDRPITMRRDTIHTRRRRPRGEGKRHRHETGALVMPARKVAERTYLGKTRIAGSEGHDAVSTTNSLSETIDTENMLTALRRQLQPHLVMALSQGQKSHTAYSPYQQGINQPSFLPNCAEMDSDSDSIADLPLNLVSTQLAETETH
ncbi:uncharacterized protein LOC132699587 [Cylas formicarius]|uniref:uncharacterized protein LOC132699587 n=1 Tax=Cylas formicarius TaxID=197179 RepID=UPI002958BFA8|nr:uncharacterized protein LOC132699587 [Cylas formicarius]XP_060522370.1 uncharacterized protein LOC132699587 [Cylas formicarius]